MHARTSAVLDHSKIEYIATQMPLRTMLATSNDVSGMAQRAHTSAQANLHSRHGDGCVPAPALGICVSEPSSMRMVFCVRVNATYALRLRSSLLGQVAPPCNPRTRIKAAVRVPGLCEMRVASQRARRGTRSVQELAHFLQRAALAHLVGSESPVGTAPIWAQVAGCKRAAAPRGRHGPHHPCLRIP
jgi:hypothetical protein